MAEDYGPRRPERSATILLLSPPEVQQDIVRRWREMELERIAWLRSLPAPTIEQAEEAVELARSHKLEDAMKTFGVLSPQAARCRDEHWKLVQRRLDRTFGRRKSERED